MTIKEAMDQVQNDAAILTQALSDLYTVQALYALEESQKAINLYGAVRSRVRLSFRSFPVLDCNGVKMGAINPSLR